ncbi:hypothetical protein JYK00_05805 [Thermosipho ferrireducens]|uniref:Uncharacterized protein n=1 Tax=Thermosipho ferrireducens TaxID=2571116 RepID=A0ABX7S4A0_9BACT|nr:hypothetical protein [Thermosipho ferrireducens]QTA37258.1 hypothetical protein JYK00_05805 [Thermosipho ferrireducens]
MKFIESFIMKYVKRDKKEYLKKVVTKLSEFLENGVKCVIQPNENYGRLRLEIYEDEHDNDLVYFSGLALPEEPMEWIFDTSEYRTFSEKLSLSKSLITNVELAEIPENEILTVRRLILKNDTAYVIVDKENTRNMNNREIAVEILNYLLKNEFLVEEFSIENYEIEIEAELTDFFQ